MCLFKVVYKIFSALKITRQAIKILKLSSESWKLIETQNEKYQFFSAVRPLLFAFGFVMFIVTTYNISVV